MSDVKGDAAKKPAAEPLKPPVEPLKPEPAAAAPPPASPVVPIAAAPERKVDPLKEMSFQEHGWKQMHYDAIAAVGVTPADVLKRDYWAHVSARLRSMTKISIMAEDRSWYGELVVFQTYAQGAVVAFIYPPVKAEKAGITREESEYEVFDGGLAKLFCVRRKKDGRIVSDMHDSAARAELWLADWLKALGSSRAA